MSREQSAGAEEGKILWEPSEELKKSANITRYMRWLAEHRGHSFESYEALWAWSVDDLDGFWSSIWEFFEVRSSTPYTNALADRKMPGASWFPGATLNYAEHARRRRDAHLALVFKCEHGPVGRSAWPQL